jgi:hypothetical protein
VRSYLNKKSWAWQHVPVIPATSRTVNMKIAFQASPSKKQESISKITRAKWTEDVAQMAECLCGKPFVQTPVLPKKYIYVYECVQNVSLDTIPVSSGFSFMLKDFFFFTLQLVCISINLFFYSFFFMRMVGIKL